VFESCSIALALPELLMDEDFAGNFIVLTILRQTHVCKAMKTRNLPPKYRWGYTRIRVHSWHPGRESIWWVVHLSILRCGKRP
jgi:hypothetical protein